MIARKIALALLAVAGLAAFQMPEAQGPAEDRVGFPDIAGLTRIRTTAIESDAKTLTIYANTPAAAVTEARQRPYPHGSVFVAEWRKVLRDAAGAAAPRRRRIAHRAGVPDRRDAQGRGLRRGLWRIAQRRVGICQLRARWQRPDPGEPLRELRRLPSKCGGGAGLRFQGSFLGAGTID